MNLKVVFELLIIRTNDENEKLFIFILNNYPFENTMTLSVIDTYNMEGNVWKSFKKLWREL